jgi:hypothetical protein
MRSRHRTTQRRVGPMPARTWVSIRVDLVEGRGENYWSWPGRLLVASRSHSYAQLARAIDDAFARWDHSHLHEFELADGTRIGIPIEDSDDDGVLDGTRENLTRLQIRQQFIYVFDFGDDWTHLCTVFEANIDPREVLGVIPDIPTPYFGWGNIPDQYGRGWSEEDSKSLTRADPGLTDLPPLRPGWGPRT